MESVRGQRHADRIFGFLDQSRYFFFHVAPQLYSRGCVPRLLPYKVCYLMSLLVLRLWSVEDKMFNEYWKVGGKRMASVIGPPQT
jgi:hypothetical protein